MSENVNTGLRVLNFPAEEAQKKEFTIVVSGLGRSGTTMISKLLTAGGIHMGVSKADVIHEDVGISNLVETDQADRFKAEVQRRNERWSVWGFKRPLIVRKHELLSATLRNPRYIIIFRDPLAVAMRNTLSMGFTIAQGLEIYSQQMVDVTRFVVESNRPKLLLSYEKVIDNPKASIAAIREFANIPAEKQDAMVSVVRPNDSEYLSAVVRKK